MKENITEKIKNWLDTQGYNLEMLTAKVFQNNGFQVAQSVHYLDYESNQSREIDLVCYYSKVVSEVSFHLTFVVECKKSNEKPWLVFKSNNQLEKYLRIEEVEGTTNGISLIKKINKTRQKNRNAIGFLDYENYSPGHGVTQAFTSGIDITHAATSTTLKAIHYFINKYKKNRTKICSLYFPTIVIDGRLFDVELKQSNEIVVNEVDKSKFIQIRSDLDKTSVLQLVTKDYLEEFCKNLKIECEAFFRIYTKQIRSTALTSPYSNEEGATK